MGLLQKKFALNVRAARQSKSMTQAEAARATGVSTSVDWRYEGDASRQARHGTGAATAHALLDTDVWEPARR